MFSPKSANKRILEILREEYEDVSKLNPPKNKFTVSIKMNKKNAFLFFDELKDNCTMNFGEKNDGTDESFNQHINEYRKIHHAQKKTLI